MKKQNFKKNVKTKLLIGLLSSGTIILVLVIILAFSLNNNREKQNVELCLDGIKTISQSITTDTTPILKKQIFRTKQDNYVINLDALIFEDTNLKYYNHYPKCEKYENPKTGFFEEINYLIFSKILGIKTDIEMYNEQNEKIRNEIKEKVENIKNNENTEIHFVLEEKSFLKKDDHIEIYKAKLKDINLQQPFTLDDIFKLERIK